MIVIVGIKGFCYWHKVKSAEISFFVVIVAYVKSAACACVAIGKADIERTS